MRPLIGMVALRTRSSRASLPDSLIALIPRSERARLIDLVKLRGVVEGSRRSGHSQDISRKQSMARKRKLEDILKTEHGSSEKGSKSDRVISCHLCWNGPKEICSGKNSQGFRTIR